MRGDFFGIQMGDVMTPACANFRGALMGNMGYTPAEAASAITSGALATVAFGHHYVSNPDLVERMKAGVALVEPDGGTFYSHGAKGYTLHRLPHRVMAVEINPVPHPTDAGGDAGFLFLLLVNQR